MAPRAAHRLGAARVREAHGTRNLRMAERLGATPVSYPFSFVVAGDSGAWPDVTADAIFASLLEQAARLEPRPPDVCVVGNHDLDDPGARETWERIHGPVNFEFAHGHTRFVAIDAAPAETPDGRPADRGSLFHAVQISIGAAGSISGRLLQAFDPVEGHARRAFP